MPTTHRKTFIQTAKHIKALGFRVFVASDETLSYGFYSDGEHIGFFQQCEQPPGIQVATVNIVPGSYGENHFIDVWGTPFPLKDITKEYLEKGFLQHPEYFSGDDRKMMPVYKYKNLDEFLSRRDPEKTLTEI